MCRTLLFIFFLVFVQGNAQEWLIKIEVKEIPNRLAFYAVNENEKDLDVMMTLKGTNFRQSKARSRFIRVPATSKVHMKTVVLVRGKQPSYTYDLVVKDSLSKRALRKEYKLIKIHPRKSITVYIPERCNSCDSLVKPLTEGKYLFKLHKLSEKPEIKEQLNRSFANTIVLDSLESPIVNLGGRLFTKIETYEQLLAALKND